MVKTVDFLLPQVSAAQLEAQGAFCEYIQDIEMVPLDKDWQAVFCDGVGYAEEELPWSFLRKKQFQLDNSVQTVCCCDPVINQLTHQGAYMVGQSQLALTPNDAIRIVTKINEVLMSEGEQLYVVDQYSWLYCNDQKLELDSKSVSELVGKDMFNFSYRGKSAAHFKKLNTEIQMLIKQMVDYGELAAPAAETMINVHFHDPIEHQAFDELSFIRNSNLSVISNNDLIKTFCTNTFLKQVDIENIDDDFSSQQIVVALDTEKENYDDVVGYWLHLNLNHKKIWPTLYCQDAMVKFKDKGNWFSNLFAK